MSSLRLLITPRDGLFLKDGRGWYTSDIGRSHSRAWPIPPTLRGALRAAFGHAWMARTGQELTPAAWQRITEDVTVQALVTVRAPMGQDPAPAHRVWPIPADALYQQTAPPAAPGPPAIQPARVVALDPGPPGQPPDHPAVTFLSADRPGDAGDIAPAVEWSALWRPRVPPGKPAPKPDFWAEQSMMSWLFPGPDRPAMPSPTGFSLPRRVDVHVTIDPETGAATPTMLFSTELTEALARQEGECFVRWAMAARVGLPDGDGAAGPLTIGGGRRLGLCQPAPAALFDPPAELGGDSPGLRLVLVTPAEFTRGWLPDGFALSAENRYTGALAGMELILRAAIVDRPLDLSTWDMVRRRPRETRRLVRPGAVYFFHKASREPFTADDRRRLWLLALGRGTGDGLGLVVPGCWHRESS